MKALVINTVPFIRDGISSLVMDYYRTLKDRVDFDFVVNTEIVEEYKNEMLINKSEIYFIKSRKQAPIKYFFFLKKILKTKNYDIIHIHGNSALMSLELLAIKEKWKIIAHGHNVSTDYPLLNKISKPYFKKNYGVGIVPSAETGEFLFENKKYHIIPNGVDLKKYAFDAKARQAVRGSLGIREQKVILCVGNLNEQKYQELIIQILPKLREKDKYIVLLIGEGTKKETLLQLADEKNVKNYVKFLGSIADVKNYYSAADVFVLPTHFESFSIVLVEAEVNGLPCITSNCVPRIVKQRENFHFVANHDLDQWIKLILKAKRTHLNEDLSIFDIEIICESLLKIYQDVSSKLG